MKLTYEAILNDPRLLERIERQAHRERARAIHEVIVLPVKRLFTHHSPLTMRASSQRSAHVQGRPTQG